MELKKNNCINSSYALRVLMKNVGEKAARVDLSSIGLSADLSLRRHMLASEDLFKKALKKPKTKVHDSMTLA